MSLDEIALTESRPYAFPGLGLTTESHGLYPEDALPSPCDGAEGYIYVAQFDTGVTKVGQARSGRARLAQHAGNARTFGWALARAWISQIHVEYRDNEGALIAEASKLSARIGRSEYFTGVNFLTLIDRSALLPATPLDRAGFKASEQSLFRERLLRRSDALSSVAWRGTHLSAPAEPVSMGESLDEIQDAVSSLAACSDLSVEEIGEMDWITIAEETALTKVRREALELRKYAVARGRGDLLTSVDEAIARVKPAPRSSLFAVGGAA